MVKIMHLASLVLFLLGCVTAGLFAVGMDPYACGIPLLLLSVAVILGSWNRQWRPRAGWVYAWILATVMYFAVRMSQSDIVDFARSDALLLVGVVLAFWWTITAGGGMMFSRWLSGLWAIAVVNIAVAMIQEYRDIEFFPVMISRATNHFPSGLYHHYNHFSNFLLGVGMISLGYGMAASIGRFMRLACFVMYALCVYGIFLAHSRGAWLGLGCGTALVIVGWLANLWRVKTSWAGAALVLATFLAPMLVVGAWQLGTSAVANRNTGDSGRLEFASIAVDLIQERPLWGGGSRSYFFDSFSKWNPKELWVASGDIEYVHNEYLQAAVDYGLVGLLLLLGLMGIVIFRGVAFLAVGENHDRKNAGIALGAMAALCAMGVQAFFSFVFHVLPDVILVGVCIGWLVRQPWALSASAKADQKQGSFPWKQGAMGTSLGLFAVAFSCRDAVAWWQLHPRIDYACSDDVVMADRYRKALAIRPDFRHYSDHARTLYLYTKKARIADAEKIVLVNQAIDSLETAIKRAPNSYEDNVNLALMYDFMGRFEKSEPIYQKVLPILDPREMYYGARYFYARHLASRAKILWYQRQPEKALVLFLRAKEELERAQYKFRDADPEVKKLIQKSIDFLEGANIKPDAGEANSPGN
jgi:O-antigen ligase